MEGMGHMFTEVQANCIRGLEYQLWVLRNVWEEVIVDLLDEINLIDMSCRFRLWMPQRASTRAWWTWSQKHQGTWHHMQPDYVMACEGEIAQFKGVGFEPPRFLHSDHRVVVASIRVGRKGRLKNYRRTRQKFPLFLPLGPKDTNTTTFDPLAAECIELKKKGSPGNDWISEGTWKLIAKCSSLLRSREIRQSAVQRLKLEVQVALKADKSRLLTTKVGDSIVLELSKGNVQEVFRHLKGWYRTASETQARPCH